MAPITKDTSGSYVTMKLDNILASAYCVDTSTRLVGFHYSTSGVGGMLKIFSIHLFQYVLISKKGRSGFPEALGNTPGHKPPATSPPLVYESSANKQLIKSKLRQYDFKSGKRQIHRKGAAYNIREECERLFCETMKVTFLGEEGRFTDNGSYEMGTDTHISSTIALNKKIDAYFEVWDYVGGCNFRGFVGGHTNKQSLFVFFENSTIHKDLKQGLMALIDFAEVVFDVPLIVLCLDRLIPEHELNPLLKSLSWVGFKPVLLESLTNSTSVISTKWFFMGMEI